MNSQMTLLAFGAKCGWPSGGAQAAGVVREAVAVQHRAQREAGEAHAEVGQERAARHAAAGVELQICNRHVVGPSASYVALVTDRDEIVVIEQHERQVLAGSLVGSADGATVAFGPPANCVSLSGSRSRSCLRLRESCWHSASSAVDGSRFRICSKREAARTPGRVQRRFAAAARSACAASSRD